MARFTEDLQIVFLAEHIVNVFLPCCKPCLWINNRKNVINLYISCYKLFLATCTFVMHSQLICLLVSFPASIRLFQGLILWGPPTCSCSQSRDNKASKPCWCPLSTVVQTFGGGGFQRLQLLVHRVLSLPL